MARHPQCKCTCSPQQRRNFRGPAYEDPTAQRLAYLAPEYEWYERFMWSPTKHKLVDRWPNTRREFNRQKRERKAMGRELWLRTHFPRFYPASAA